MQTGSIYTTYPENFITTTQVHCASKHSVVQRLFILIVNSSNVSVINVSWYLSIETEILKTSTSYSNTWTRLANRSISSTKLSSAW